MPRDNFPDDSQLQLPPALCMVDNNIRRQARFAPSTRIVPEESPVALSYDGTTHAVMMASPQDLADFAVGFSLSEGIITRAREIEAMDIVMLDAGIDVQMQLSAQQRQALTARRRHRAGPVGCGLCGIESLSEALRDFTPVVPTDFSLSAQQIVQAAAQLSDLQILHQRSRAVHGAGFYLPVAGQGTVVALREDVGRHNALDKLAGALLRMAAAKPYIDPARGAVVITSRVSLEMVQKTAAIGVPVMIAISAPTALAIRTAEALNITLIALLRGEEFDIYTHQSRIRA